MLKKATSINLIKTDKNELLNQIINWALTVGRVLIIIVELIALSAFMYRFFLDNQLRDITGKIQQEEAILSIQQKNEATYRNLQDRLTLETTIINQGARKTKIVKDIIALAPQGISFVNFSYSNNQVIIELNAGSVFPLSSFITSLKAYPLTNSISIDTVENQAANSNIHIALTINLKDQGGQNANSGN